jgi:regulator of nucleoside diphosphate kinase
LSIDALIADSASRPDQKIVVGGMLPVRQEMRRASVFQTHPIILTTKDYATLEAMLYGDDGHHIPRAAALRHKLAGVIVVPTTEIAADVVTLGSRVRFRIGDGPSQERTIIASNADEVMGLTLLAWTSRGLTLLGMRAGPRARCLRFDGTSESIIVEAVLFRPVDCRGEPALGGSNLTDTAPQLPPGGNVRCLSSYRRQRGGDLLLGPDSDDWGPGAA